MNRIKERRRALGLSQKELAERLNVTIATVSRYERGDREVTLPVLQRIAKALQCHPAELIAWEDAHPTDEELFLDTARILVEVLNKTKTSYTPEGFTYALSEIYKLRLRDKERTIDDDVMLAILGGANA